MSIDELGRDAGNAGITFFRDVTAGLIQALFAAYLAGAKNVAGVLWYQRQARQYMLRPV